ncbi:MAG: transglycosylase SLT domain-containing protein [Pseudomonadota bacterium]
MNRYLSLFSAGFLLIGAQLIPQTAQADLFGSNPELKISYSLTTLSEARDDEASAQDGDLWERIRTGFKLPESDPRLTRVHEQYFAGNPGYLQRAVQRSRLYLFHIVEEVEKRGMPTEIALLPIIESAFNPQAQSPMKASGMWQFIPSTGRIYGLEQNAWYDGRRDVLQATDAALDYLQNLYAMFGDWELALAAYNCGEGCVARARNRGNGSDYASIKLPNETRNYVPKLVAVRNIIQDPQRFGFNLESVVNEAYFMQVTLSRPMEAHQAAKMAEMSLDEFLSLNPAFQRRVIYADSRNVLLLPVDRVETFQFNMHRQGAEKQLQTYTAQRGESASSIASKFGVSLDWLKEYNPLNLIKGKVAKPTTLVVPATRTAQAAPAAQAKPRAVAKPAARVHTVRRGDTLSHLAKLYNVKVADLRRVNSKAEPLKPGTKLTIPPVAS